MADYITGFETSEGVKKYDYNALANLPTNTRRIANVTLLASANTSGRLPASITYLHGVGFMGPGRNTIQGDSFSTWTSIAFTRPS